jgi:hypothetical protein
LQLKQKDLKSWRLATLEKQNGLCALCGLPLPPEKSVSDHCHTEGWLRGVCHRSCNSVLGKIENGYRYGREFNPIAFAKGLFNYLTKEHDPVLHPLHGKPKRKRRK